MAAEHASGEHAAGAPAGGHPAMDYAEHNRTYNGFIKATVAVVLINVLLLIGMAAFLV